MLFDSHAHINNEDMTPETREALAEAIERSQLDYVMDIGFDLASSRWRSTMQLNIRGATLQ